MLEFSLHHNVGGRYIASIFIDLTVSKCTECNPAARFDFVVIDLPIAKLTLVDNAAYVKRNVKFT